MLNSLRSKTSKVPENYGLTIPQISLAERARHESSIYGLVYPNEMTMKQAVMKLLDVYQNKFPDRYSALLYEFFLNHKFDQHLDIDQKKTTMDTDRFMHNALIQLVLTRDERFYRQYYERADPRLLRIVRLENKFWMAYDEEGLEKDESIYGPLFVPEKRLWTSSMVERPFLAELIEIKTKNNILNFDEVYAIWLKTRDVMKDRFEMEFVEGLEFFKYLRDYLTGKRSISLDYLEQFPIGYTSNPYSRKNYTVEFIFHRQANIEMYKRRLNPYLLAQQFNYGGNLTTASNLIEIRLNPNIRVQSQIVTDNEMINYLRNVADAICEKLNINVK
ncbi:MAG: hypothetical protein WCJ19_04700 [bacterium]